MDHLDDPAPGIPVTVHPGQDVHLAPGRPLGELRAGLAACTGRTELLRSSLWVADRRLDDHHVVGHPPLVAGAVLRTAASSADGAERALQADLHIAVLAGPRTGELLPVADARRPPGGPGTRADRAVGWGLDLRTRHGRRGPWVQVRSGGADRDLTLTCPGARPRPRRVGPERWRRWRTGEVLTLGGSGATAVALELRARPDLTAWSRAAVLAALAPSAGGPPGPGSVRWTGSAQVGARAPSRSASPLVLVALVPAALSIVLAIVLRNPLFALMALSGPLMILTPLLLRRRAEREAAGPGPTGSTGPSAAASGAPTAGPGASGADAALVRRAGLHPADLLTCAVATSTLPRGALCVGPGTDGAPRREVAGTTGQGAGATGGTSRPGDLPDGCLAVVGPRAATLPLARGVVASLQATGRASRLHVLHEGPRTRDWRWARWLPGASALHPDADLPGEAGEGQLLVVDVAGPGRLYARLGAWHAGRGARAAVLLLVEDPAEVPSWCGARAVVDPEARSGQGETRWTGPGGDQEVTALAGPDGRWIEDYARRVCALDQRGRWPSSPGEDAGPPGPAGSSTPHARGRLPRRASLLDVLRSTPSGQAWSTLVLPGGPGDPDPSPPQRAARPHPGTPEADGGSLRAPIGVGADGAPVVVDLVRDGPHTLVAGTTGAGKSELLQTLVLALALEHSPDDLALALVDYKGGASFGACAGLPHVVGQVTDLDPGAATRALAGLRAELRRRERLFADVGVGTLTDYRRVPVPETLPRLVVVVDEFRAMADDHPEFIPGLVRIAAQGRSLGIHLVLATQRPSGAITPDMRANISLRIALRVVDPADSLDVIDAPDAASIPADLPGRAILRRGLAAPETLQTCYAPAPATGARRDVRPAPAWMPDAAPVAAPSRSRSLHGAVPAETEGAEGAEAASVVGRARPQDTVALLVARTHEAVRARGIGLPRVPWTSALPTEVTWLEARDHDLLDATAPRTAPTHAPPAAAPVHAPPASLVLGIADHPEDQRHRTVRWAPAQGHLLVLGRAGTGRTTTLRTLAHGALAAGLTVHLVGPPALSEEVVAGADARAGEVVGAIGTVASRTDPRRVARLLQLLIAEHAGEHAAPPGCVAHLVLVDGLDDLLPAMAALQRGGGADLLTGALRDGLAHGVAVAATTSVTPSTSVATLLRHRLVLSGRDRHDDLYLGIPTDLAGQGGHPGRGVLLGGERPLVCQVALDPAPSLTSGGAGGLSEGPGGLGEDPGGLGEPGRPRALGPAARATAERTRVCVVPRTVVTTDLGPASVPGAVVLGLGADDARTLEIGPAAPLLVCGPHGSGRSSVLALLLSPSHGAATHRLLGVVSRDEQLAARARAVPGLPVLDRLGAEAVARFRAAVLARHDRLSTEGSSPVRLVVDDLDAMALAHPLVLDELCALGQSGAGATTGHDAATARPAATDDDGAPRAPVALAAAATTVAAAGAFRGPLADLRAARNGVVLAPGTAGSSEVFGLALGWHVEPEVTQPGRGVLVLGSRSTFLQVARPD